jgi:hypothetical protein
VARQLFEIVPRLPQPVRVTGRRTLLGFGKATARWRPLPDFIVIGAMKAGTTALYAFLREHPDITGPLWKETSHFDRYGATGERAYRAHFPIVGRRPDVLVGEASPGYLFHPRVAGRVHALMPDVRLVVILRDPVARAFSHYQHALALGRERLSFEAALAAEPERLAGVAERIAADPGYFSHEWWNHSYYSRGLYAQQIETWLQTFPREQLLVITNDRLGSEPDATYRRVLAHIGARPHSLPSYGRVYEGGYTATITPRTEALLRERYAESDAKLDAMDILGEPVPWLAQQR